MQLRDYQKQAVQQIYNRWAEGYMNVCYQLPTGGGKTVVLGHIIANHRGYSIAVAHRLELVSQLSLTLARFGIRHNIIAQRSTIREIVAIHMLALNKSYFDPNAPCYVAAVDTLIRLPSHTPWFSKVTLIVQDEAHHVLDGNKWGAAARLFPNARGLYPTATPTRADGKGLGRDNDGIFDTLVSTISMRELIDQGQLSDYRIFSPPNALDLSDVTITATGDYSPPKLRQAVHKSKITGDVVSHYLKIAPGKLGITFCVDIEAATEIALEFKRCGVPAEVISSKTPDLLRYNIMRKFRNREILQLVNVDIVGEGVDIPGVEVVSMVCPTQSYTKFAQQFGRALRPLPGKTCVARGTKVLTHRGEVSIEDVTLDHLLWDGVSFVNHSGAVCMSIKKTIDYKGLSATPDHKVMTSRGWIDFEKAATKRIRIIKTGISGVPIRYFGDSIPIRRRRVLQIKGFSKMQNLRVPLYASISQYEKTNSDPGVYQLQRSTKNNGAEMVISPMPTTALTLYQPKSYRVSKLRRARHTISVPYGKRCVKMGNGLFRGSKRPKEAIRQDRQRRALRTGQSAMGYCRAELQQLKDYSRSKSNKIYRISKKLSFCRIRGFNLAKINIKIYRLRNNKQMGFTFAQTEREVWDILNSGALQRFTANGYLVHNCAIIIDHVNNVIRHGLPDSPRVWTLERKERRARSTPEDVVPLKTCLSCFAVYTRLNRTCPHCGHYSPPMMRSTPDFVDGDLTELDHDTLARLRGEISRIDGQAHPPSNLAPFIQVAIRNKHAARIDMQTELREHIALWAGYKKHEGFNDSEIYRLFYFKFQIDVLTAQTLGLTDADVLIGKIEMDIDECANLV